jgi:phospholipase C
VRGIVFAAAGLALSGCGGGTAVAPPPVALQAPGHRHSSGSPIQHVVIVIQENRSFNNLFYGYPHAKTAKYGYDTYGDKLKLKAIGLETTWDLQHDAGGFFGACHGTGSIPGTDCKMNGFNLEYATCGGSEPCPIKYPPYAYVPHSETQPYFDIAKQYVLADQMYASNLDASSFVSHQYIIAAQAESAVNFPYGAWGCPGGSGDSVAEIGSNRKVPNGYEVPCWNPTTLGDELDNAGISWAYYAVSYSDYPGIWSAYQAIKHIYEGADWQKDVISPPSQFLSDVSNGKLRTVTWVTPTCANSDHAGCGSKTGPMWVASLVNAIGESKYWNSTAMFIFWDDYGGWFDPEPPTYEDYDGLGLRIPMLIVSPYAKQGVVDHTRYEHGTILKFIENLFNLSPLSASDKRANAPDNAFDFSKPPRAFQKIPSSLGEEYFLHEQPPDHRLPDSN